MIKTKNFVDRHKNPKLFTCAMSVAELALNLLEIAQIP